MIAYICQKAKYIVPETTKRLSCKYGRLTTCHLSERQGCIFILPLRYELLAHTFEARPPRETILKELGVIWYFQLLHWNLTAYFYEEFCQSCSPATCCHDVVEQRQPSIVPHLFQFVSILVVDGPLYFLHHHAHLFLIKFPPSP